MAALTRAGAVMGLPTSDDDLARQVAEAHPGVTAVRRERDHLELTAEEHTVGALSRALVDAGALIYELSSQSATLEDVFFSLTEEREPAPQPAGAL
jgi:hypothetical protein